MTSCVTSTVTSPDGTVTKSSAFLTVEQIRAAAEAAASVKGKQTAAQIEPVK